MSKDLIHYEKIVRGLKNRGKNFAPGDEIILDDEGFIRQSGVDENGIPIIHKAYDEEIKKIANDVREEMGKPKYQWFGYKTTIGLTKNELINYVENNPYEILLDMPLEIKEYQKELKEFILEWSKKLKRKSPGICHMDDSNIWDGSEFIENKIAKAYNEEYDKTHKTHKRPILKREN